MAHRVVEHLNPDFSLPSLAQGATVILITVVLALGVGGFLIDSDVYAEAFGLPDRPLVPAASASSATPSSGDSKPSDAISKTPAAAANSSSDSDDGATNPWVYVSCGRTVALALSCLEFVRRNEWRTVGLLLLPIAIPGAVDAFTTWNHGSRAVAVRHALWLPLFLGLGSYLAFFAEGEGFPT